MPPFGRQDPTNGRTAEEREAARLERERRRAGREGLPVPDEPVDEPAPVEPASGDGRFDGDDGGAASFAAGSQDRDGSGRAAGFDGDEGAAPSAGEDAAAFDGSEPAAGFDDDADRAANGDGPRSADTAVDEPADVVAAAPTARRTVQLPRPQTDTGEWDAPIGTIRVSRGARYEAQPGAPGYPPYRKLVTKPRRRWLRRIVALLALLAVVAAAAAIFLFFQPLHGQGSGSVVVRIPPGATAREIGDILDERGVVPSGFFFSLRARLSGQREELLSGTYRLRRGMSYGAALTALTTPPKAVPVVDVTLPEGPSRRELAPLVRKAGLKGSYVRATRRSARLNPRNWGAPRGTRTLEGFLFPSTYELRRRGATAKALVGRQLDAFKAAFRKVDLRTARRRNLTRYDVLIIASMIEREAAVPRDRALVSAVIYNRLRRGMPLGIDATLRYRLNQWTRPLRVSELATPSAFNTRRRLGLPPTPIGNPGLAAIRAAANPARVPYLFYVVRPCGNGAHAFSSTDAQFQRDVARYNRARDRRGGKDPSRC